MVLVLTEQPSRSKRLLFMISCVLFLIFTARYLGLVSAGFFAILILYCFWRLTTRREREQEALERRSRHSLSGLDNDSDIADIDYAISTARRARLDDEANFPFAFSNTATTNNNTSMTPDQWQELIRRHVPSGAILKTSDTQLHADFDNEIVEVDESCPVCLVEYEHGETVLSSPMCQHVFHSHCVLAWLVQNNDCPCCRREFVPKNLIGARVSAPALLPPPRTAPQPPPPPPPAVTVTNNNSIQQQSASSSSAAEEVQEADTTLGASEEVQEADTTLGREQQSSLPRNPIIPDTITESER